MATNTTRADAAPAAQLKRALGVSDLTWLCVVATLNLNVVPVIAANGAFTLWLWVASLLFFFLPQGIAVIELSHRFPGEGGVYLWAKQMFGDFHGFLCGWCYWVTNMFFVPTLLFYLAGIFAYLGKSQSASLADNSVFFFCITLGLLWLSVFLNVLGLGIGKWVNNLGGIGTLFSAIILVTLGIVTVARRGIAIPSSAFAMDKLDWPVVSSFGVICFGLVGLELGSVMGDEIRDPLRTVPRGVLRGGLLTGVFYLLTTAAMLLTAPQGGLGTIQGIWQSLDMMTAPIHLSWVLTPVALLMAAAIAGSTSAWVGGSARIMFVSGLDRYLPRALGRIHPRYATPHVALIALGALSTLLVSMSFIGSSVKEAYVTLLDLAVVLQMISYLYFFGALARLAFRPSSEPFFLGRGKVRFAAVSGLATTSIGMVVAFVPSHQVSSIWTFELKVALGTVFFLALAGALFIYYSRQKREVS